jgi:hypothetical protein
MSEKLMCGVFLFTGLELFQTLSAKQLSALLQHQWNQREYTEEEAPDKYAQFKEAAVQDAASRFQRNIQGAGTEENPGDSTLNRLGLPEKKNEVQTVKDFCKNLTTLLETELEKFDLKACLQEKSLLAKDPDPFDLTNLPHTVEVLRTKLTVHLKCLVQANLSSQVPRRPDPKSHIQLDENLEVLRGIQHGESWDGLMLELTRKEKLLRDTLAHQVNHKSLQHVCVCVLMCKGKIHNQRNQRLIAKLLNRWRSSPGSWRDKGSCRTQPWSGMEAWVTRSGLQLNAWASC